MSVVRSRASTASLTSPLHSPTAAVHVTSVPALDPKTRPVLPLAAASAFKALKYLPVHYLDRVTKTNRLGKAQQRVVICTETHLYSCLSDGDVQRCLALASVAELRMNSALSEVTLMVPSEYDFHIKCSGPSALQKLTALFHGVPQTTSWSKPPQLEKPPEFKKSPSLPTTSASRPKISLPGRTYVRAAPSPTSPVLGKELPVARRENSEDVGRAVTCSTDLCQALMQQLDAAREEIDNLRRENWRLRATL